MEFGLTPEQRMLVESLRAFVEKELIPHEELVERTDRLPPELAAEIRRKAIAAGFYAANMPEELGGGGLDNVSVALLERELGRANYALHWTVARPSNILRACQGEQVERYLKPTIRGERVECLAMTEPGAGSDLRSMTTRAVREGDHYVINGRKHFISHADVADYVILFAASGVEETRRGSKKKITSFLVDKGTPGFEVTEGYRSVSHRGYHNCQLVFTDCRVPVSQILGEEHRGFEVANEWLGNTRLQVAATCVGRAQRAIELATECAAAELLTLMAAWKLDQGAMTDSDAAMAKLYSTEMLARVTDQAIQIYGGMGLMSLLPLERLWRDARVERIWDGTSEIQRHIISRAMLRPLEKE